MSWLAEALTPSMYTVYFTQQASMGFVLGSFPSY